VADLGFFLQDIRLYECILALASSDIPVARVLGKRGKPHGGPVVERLRKQIDECARHQQCGRFPLQASEDSRPVDPVRGGSPLKPGFIQSVPDGRSASNLNQNTRFAQVPERRIQLGWLQTKRACERFRVEGKFDPPGSPVPNQLRFTRPDERRQCDEPHRPERLGRKGTAHVTGLYCL
jgi:hypothetical protein